MFHERQQFWVQNYESQDRATHRALIEQFKAEGRPVPELEPLKRVLPPIGNPSKASGNLSTIHAGNLSCRPDDLSTVLEQTSPQVSDVHDQTLRNPDFAHATRGRTYDYLKSRKNMNPDQKYGYPLTAAMDQSWGIDFKGRSTTSQYGRKSIIQDTFYTKTTIPGMSNN